MIDRRRLLRCFAVPGLIACSAACRQNAGHQVASPRPDLPAPAPSPAWPRTSFPLAGFPDRGRTVVPLGGYPVEVRREGGRLTARSLLCTHMGCTVSWQEEAQRYRCPCHEGFFDAEGRAVQGPMPRDLDPVPVSVTGETVTLG